MQISEIQDVLNKELQESEFTSEIKPYLVAPSKGNFETDDGSGIELWVVLEKEGYFIVYDEQNNSFGIAFRNILNEMILLESTGTLTEAYKKLTSKEPD